MTAFSSALMSNPTPGVCEACAAARVVESLEDSASRVALRPTLVVADAEFRQAARPETAPELEAMPKGREAKSEKAERSGLQHAAQRWHGARCSVERGVQLLARLASLVSERQRAYQRKVQGVPVRCNASFGCILRRAAAPRRLLVRANQPTTQLRCSWAGVRGAGPQRATKSKRGPASMVPAARDLE